MAPRRDNNLGGIRSAQIRLERNKPAQLVRLVWDNKSPGAGRMGVDRTVEEFHPWFHSVSAADPTETADIATNTMIELLRFQRDYFLEKQS